MIGAARMDLDGDGHNVFDQDDLTVATAAFWTEVGAGHALPNSDEEDTYIWRYHPYGNTAKRTGVKPVYGFVGGEIEEEELGLIQYGARWYAPEIGRWVSADPLFLEVAVNNVDSTFQSGLYIYSVNSPANVSDLSGADIFHLIPYPGWSDEAPQYQKIKYTDTWGKPPPPEEVADSTIGNGGIDVDVEDE